MGFFDQIGGFFKSTFAPVTTAWNNLTGVASHNSTSTSPVASARLNPGSIIVNPSPSAAISIIPPQQGMMGGFSDYETPMLIGGAALLGILLLR